MYIIILYLSIIYKYKISNGQVAPIQQGTMISIDKQMITQYAERSDESVRQDMK